LVPGYGTRCRSSPWNHECFCCRAKAPDLEEYKAFIDAGWFLDIAPYASRTDGFTFQAAARALAGTFNASFDRYLRTLACQVWQSRMLVCH
jgi:hypothetical protein